MNRVVNVIVLTGRWSWSMQGQVAKGIRWRMSYIDAESWLRNDEFFE